MSVRAVKGLGAQVRRAFTRPRAFHLFERLGVHVTSVHFYSPIPNVHELMAEPGLWERKHELPGLDMRDEAQRSLMRDVFQRYRQAGEFDFPAQPTGVPPNPPLQHAHIVRAIAGTIGKVLLREMRCSPITLEQGAKGRFLVHDRLNLWSD